MNKILLIFIVLIFDIGCMPVERVYPVRDQLYSAGIGEWKTSFVGDPIFYLINGESRPGFVAKEAYNNGKRTLRGVTLEPRIDIAINSEWIVIGKGNKDDFLCSNNQNQSCLFIKSAAPANKYYAFAWEDCDTESMRTYFDLEVPTGAIFEKVDRIFISGHGYSKRELLYNGKAGNTIKISYREYKDDLARPAFTQDLIYDLAESKIIGFQGMQIEVLNATNEYINFIIRSLLR